MKSGSDTGPWGSVRVAARAFVVEQRATNSYFNAEGIGASDAMIRPVILLDQQVCAKYPGSPTLKCFEKVCLVDGGGGWSII